MKSKITSLLNASIEVKKAAVADEVMLDAVEKATKLMLEVDKKKGTIYICGNGGSACDSIHFTEELVARYKRERRGIRAMHFLDPGILTCWSNDYEFAGVFERPVDTFCTPNDVLIVITTSGNSENLIRAAQKAKQKGAKVIGLLGKGGGKIKPLCDIPIIVPSSATERIQEVHITLIHTFCELIEEALDA